MGGGGGGLIIGWLAKASYNPLLHYRSKADGSKLKLEARKAKDAEVKAVKRQLETPEERQERLRDLSQRKSARLQLETPEERQERLRDLSQRKSARLQLETPEERQVRLQMKLQSMQRYISCW